MDLSKVPETFLPLDLSMSANPKVAATSSNETILSHTTEGKNASYKSTAKNDNNKMKSSRFKKPYGKTTSALQLQRSNNRDAFDNLFKTGSVFDIINQLQKTITTWRLFRDQWMDLDELMKKHYSSQQSDRYKKRR